MELLLDNVEDEDVEEEEDDEGQRENVLALPADALGEFVETVILAVAVLNASRLVIVMSMEARLL
jgi:hypothetical protein